MLRCEECDAVCQYGEGWVAYRVGDDETPAAASAHVVAYCPTCAERKFRVVSSRAHGSTVRGNRL